MVIRKIGNHSRRFRLWYESTFEKYPWSVITYITDHNLHISVGKIYGPFWMKTYQEFVPQFLNGQLFKK